jgi:hypothetical protein
LRLAQLFDHGIGEILIGVEQHPQSLHEALLACFVLTDGAVDLLRMDGGVFPGGFQVHWRQRRISAKDVCLATSEATVVHQHPNGNAAAADAGIATADVGRLRDVIGCRGYGVVSGWASGRRR